MDQSIIGLPGPEAGEVGAAPRLLTATGRQRVGKTGFLNALAQIARARGADLDVINADPLNRSHSLSTFHADAATIGDSSLEEQMLWLEDRLGEQVARRRDAVIDVGGGLSALHRVIQETPLAEVMADEGVTFTLAFVVGTDAADLDYLDSVLNDLRFRPTHTLIVLNEGLVANGLNPRRAFEPVIRHRLVAESVAYGGLPIFWPQLRTMPDVAARGLSYERYLSGAPLPAGQAPIGPFDRARVRRWFETDVPAALRRIPAAWLPRLAEDQGW